MRTSANFFWQFVLLFSRLKAGFLFLFRPKLFFIKDNFGWQRNQDLLLGKFFKN